MIDLEKYQITEYRIVKAATEERLMQLIKDWLAADYIIWGGVTVAIDKDVQIWAQAIVLIGGRN